MERALRGIRILKQRSGRFHRLKLMQVNGRRYVVSLQRFLLGIQLQSHRYEFLNKEEAEYFFDRILIKFRDQLTSGT